MPSADGTTPLQVMNYAYKELQKTLRWEKVFCVFDRDDHPHFDNALLVFFLIVFILCYSIEYM